MEQRRAFDLWSQADEVTQAMDEIEAIVNAGELAQREPEVLSKGGIGRGGKSGARKIAEFMTRMAENGIDIKGLVARANSPKLGGYESGLAGLTALLREVS